MKEFLLIIFMLATICFCVYHLAQAIMYNKFLKNQSEDFDKLLTKITEEAIKEIDKKSEKKVVKKTTTRKTKKSEKKEEK